MFLFGTPSDLPKRAEPSAGSRGDSYDNALAETINGLYKTELIHRRAPWKTRESVEFASLEWVACSGLMKPDTNLGENARHNEVSDEQATSIVFS